MYHKSHIHRTEISSMGDMRRGEWGIVVKSDYEVVGRLVYVDGRGVCHDVANQSTFSALDSHLVQLFKAGDECTLNF